MQNSKCTMQNYELYILNSALEIIFVQNNTNGTTQLDKY